MNLHGVFSFANPDPSSSAIAAPTAPSGPFVIGVTTAAGKTLYLTGEEAASEKLSDGIQCTLAVGKIACGPEKLGYTYGNQHTSDALVPDSDAPNNKNWAIGSDNVISWKTTKGEVVNFSTKDDADNIIYAEVCTAKSHPDKVLFHPGTAKAYFV